MTALLYDLTASPHYHLARRPPAAQPHVTMAHTAYERTAESYWQASYALSQQAVFGLALGWAIGLLGFLAMSRTFPDVQRRARTALGLRGNPIVLRPAPGPFNGGAA